MDRVVQAGEVRSARIESLRALAALAVLESHAWGISHGWYGGAIADSFPHRVLLGGGSGVFVFFALSGYLLAWPFFKRDFGGGQPIDLRRYALNRVLRILPLYYVAVVVLLLVQEGGGSLGQWWRFALLAENFSETTLRQVDTPLWSVVVEIHFYALLPLFALGLAALTRRRRGLAFAALVAIGLAGIAFRHWALARSPHTVQMLRYSLPGTFYFFVPGMLLALMRVAWQERRPVAVRGILESPTAWLLAAVPFWAVHFDRYWDWPAAVGSFLVVGACVLPLRDAAPVRALEWRPLATLGIASYSLYVWHMPIVEALERAVDAGYGPLLGLGLAVCIPVALVSYRLIEAPLLRLRRRWTRAEAPLKGPFRSESLPSTAVA